MAHKVDYSTTDSDLLIPNSFLVTVRCDMVACANTMSRHVNGFSDGMEALRHFKGWLIADEGWRSLNQKDKNLHVMVCHRHRKEV